MGFGAGSFGRGGLGAAAWTRKVFWEDLPEQYRTEDASQGNILESVLQDVISPPVQRVLDKVSSLADLRDAYSVRADGDEAVAVTLGAYVADLDSTRVQVLLDTYPDDLIAVLGEVTKGWLLDDGLTRFLITGIQRVLTASGLPELTLNSISPPRTAIQRSGADGGVTADVFDSPTARFTALDLGAEVYVSGAAVVGNNTHAAITEILSDRTVRLAHTFAAEANNGALGWAIRQSSAQTKLLPPEMLGVMAAEVSADIDLAENTERQRCQVHNIDEWLNLKGSDKGYVVLGKIAGFDVLAEPLWRITDARMVQFSSDVIVELRERPAFLQGRDGTLITSGARVVFTSPTARFTAAMEGRHIRLFDALSGPNQGRHKVTSFIDAQTVVLDGGLVEDLRNGSLDWAVLRFYCIEPPTRHSFDEIAADVIPLDTFCWEPGGDVPSVPVTIVSVTSLTATKRRVRITGSDLSFLADVGADGIGGAWLQAAGGAKFYIEAVPTHISGTTYDVDVESESFPMAPAAAVTFGVDCPVQSDCSYCGAAVLRLTMTVGDVAEESGPAIQRLLQRVMTKLSRVVPAHVEVVPRFVQTMETTVNVSVSLETYTETTLLAPVDALFDEIPADEIGLDGSMLYATLETP